MAPGPNAAAGPSKPAAAGGGGTAQVTALQKEIYFKLKNAKESVSGSSRFFGVDGLFGRGTC